MAPLRRMPFSVSVWWVFLCALAAVNIAAWLFAAVSLARGRPGWSTDEYAARRLQLVLSGLYVFGCAFRSAFLVYDIPRICVFDTPLSTVLIGRSVASVAEVSFAAQWALMLAGSARAIGSTTVLRVSRLIVPFIVIAEISSWIAVLSTANLGHVIENSLWGVSAAMIVMSLMRLMPRWPQRSRAVLGIWIAAGLAYVVYMFAVDVPMYWARWIADESVAKQYLTIAQGIADAAACKLASQSWDDWRHEVAWMTLYFSGGVWASISLVLISPGVDARRA
jgi:hypothetical protein